MPVSQRWSIIASDVWQLTIIVLRSLFLAGPSTDRAPPETLHPQMNSLTLPSLGLEIPIHGSERRGEGRIGEADFATSNLTGSGWPGAAPKSAWSTEGRLREPALQALLRELAAFNTGLCVTTTRTSVADIQITSAPRLFVVTWNNI